MLNKKDQPTESHFFRGKALNKNKNKERNKAQLETL